MTYEEEHNENFNCSIYSIYSQALHTFEHKYEHNEKIIELLLANNRTFSERIEKLEIKLSKIENKLSNLME